MNYAEAEQIKRWAVEDHIVSCEDIIEEYKDRTFDSLADLRAAYISGVRKRPHLRDAINVSVPDALAIAAFGKEPTLKAQGELVKTFGNAVAANVAAQWRSTLGSLKPGKAPGGEIQQLIKNADVRKPSSNPWDPNARFPTLQARRDAQASFTKAAGSKAAVAMAKPFLDPRG